MRVFYSDRYTIELPPGHRFPMEKYRMVRDALVGTAVLRPEDLAEAPLATPEMILRAHGAGYFAAVRDGTLDRKAILRLGLPWSPALYVRSLATVGGAVAAAEEALRSGVSGNLAGGTHHAFADAGEGFCVFNDQAVAALHLLATGRVRRLAVVDLDVHQGNGTAALLGRRPDVFLLDVHGAQNFPFRKVPATLHVGLPDGVTDDDYLDALERSLPDVFLFEPELVLYQAGVDALVEDRLGRLALTHEGLAERDRLVLTACRRHRVPVALALGGGYAVPIAHTVTAHVNSYRAVREVFSPTGRGA